MNFRNWLNQLNLALKTKMGLITVVVFLFVTAGIFFQYVGYQSYAERTEEMDIVQEQTASKINLNVQFINLLQATIMPPNDALIHAANKMGRNEVSAELSRESEDFDEARRALQSFYEENRLFLDEMFYKDIMSQFEKDFAKGKSIFEAADMYWKTQDAGHYRDATLLMEEFDNDITKLIKLVKENSTRLLVKYEGMNTVEAIERKEKNNSRKKIMFLAFAAMLIVGLIYLVRVGKVEELSLTLKESNRKLLEAYDDTEVLIAELMEKKELFQELSIRDGLTGLYNRRHFEELLENEINRMKRYRKIPFSLMMIDIDHFKAVNDTYGHLVGDEVLKSVAAILHEGERKTDISGRYGGEEFIVFLPETNLEGAEIKAERLRKAIENHSFECNGKVLSITISIGVCQYQIGDTLDRLIADGDSALYKAKRAGRNRVKVFEEIQEQAEG